MNCLHCHKQIEGKRNTKKYCSNTCKQYAYLNRSFSVPSNLNGVTINSTENKIVQTNEMLDLENELNTLNPNLDTPPTIEKETISINQQTTRNHEYKNQLIEEEYKYIYADILDRIQHGYISLNYTNIYFTYSTKNGGRITEQNVSAFAYILPRIRCIIENLFQLTYKRKLYYNTAITICKALEEILLSEQIKTLPGDFPFIIDLIKLHEQFMPIASYLESEKDGIKFKLTKSAIVRYILILNLIRESAKKEPFNKLFPELCKPAKPNTSKFKRE
ncbi:MAG: hypothetical protein Q7W45_15355 [Bacteroidota bacterium]|nr:hypothetical protein [Bacteroidota bacterium]MDP3145609.1 hypothetical protein [Bacteroidota bacterium]